MMDLARKIREAAMYECLDALIVDADQIVRLLDNGRPILESSYGSGFNKLHTKRLRMRQKHEDIMKSVDVIYNLINKKRK